MFNGKSVTGPRRPEIAERSKAEDISCIPGDQNGVALGTTLPPPGFPLRKRFGRIGVNGRRVEDDIIVNRQHSREVSFNSIFDHDCHGADPAHTFGSGSMAGYGRVSQTFSILVGQQAAGILALEGQGTLFRAMKCRRVQVKCAKSRGIVISEIHSCLVMK